MMAAVGLRVITTRPSGSFWAILAALLVLFAAPAFAPGGVPRAPYEARYIFPGVLMLLLLLSEVGRGVRLRGGYAYAAGAAGAIVFAFAMYSNTSELESRARYWANRASQTKAELSVLDLARGTVWPVVLGGQSRESTADPPRQHAAGRRRLLPGRRCLRLAGLQPCAARLSACAHSSSRGHCPRPRAGS